MSSLNFNLNKIIGPEDLLYIGNPQISYFSSVFRRHSQFTQYSISKSLDSLTKQLKMPSHEYHLLKSVTLHTKYAGNGSDKILSNIGTNILTNIEYSFGGGTKPIEKISGSYIEKYNQLHTPLNLYSIYTQTTDNTIEVLSGNKLNTLSYSGGVFNHDNIISGSQTGTIDIKLPIPFSFSQNIGHALPYFLFNDGNQLIFTIDYDETVNNVNPLYEGLILDCIKLGEEEKRRFERSSNDYIYTIIKEYTIRNGEIEIDRFKNIKSIIWDSSVKKDAISISVNNIKLVEDLESVFFTRVFPKKAGLPGCGRDFNGSNIFNDDSISYYTFGLNEGLSGEDNSPNGNINSSANQIKIVGLDGHSVFLLCYCIIKFNKEKSGPVILGGNIYS